MSVAEAVVKGSETRIVKSEYTGSEYLISLGLPARYPQEPDKRWPAVYLLDGNLFFGLVTDMVRSMSWCGMTSDAIVVGIGYVTDSPLAEAWREVMAWRTKDLTPERDDKTETDAGAWLNRPVQSGGASQFSQALEGELMPLVESNYRVDEKERTLAGHSYGGLFALYALFQKPALFRNYVACSPSVGYKDGWMFRLEELYARRRKTLPASLFLSSGELESGDEDSLELMNRFASQVESHEYGRLALEKKTFAGDDHCTVIAPSLQAGLKRALRK